jgi:hypothetical protein
MDLNSGHGAAPPHVSPPQNPPTQQQQQAETQNSGTSEFSGLVSYFSSQHELD